jgi:hypothetical protein
MALTAIPSGGMGVGDDDGDDGDDDAGGDGAGEWMVISGGFAKDNWEDFLVWLYDLSLLALTSPWGRRRRRQRRVVVVIILVAADPS